jgi:ATP-dependent Lhr-like helicase
VYDPPPATTHPYEHLFSVLRGHDNLVFANSRRQVEIFTDQLQRRSDQLRVPNEFFPHHGSLSKEFREDVEARLKSPEQPATAICTSTLEMGIDIGSVDSIAQVGAPGSAAALRQRLGRSGRRGSPATLRLYITEAEITPQTPLPDMIRTELVETIATVELLLEQWFEPPNVEGLHLSTLVQQILSVIAQHGGARAAELYSALCADGPFHHVTSTMFVQLLRDLGRRDLVMQTSDGLLLPGTLGERLINHYSFYTAFQTAEEYRLITQGRALGTMPVTYPVLPGGFMIFAGQRWQVVDVDAEDKVIDLIHSRGARPPLFSGDGPTIADGIRQRMRQVYESDELPGYLDSTAQRLLAEARANYRNLGIASSPIFAQGNTTWIFPWKGDRVMNTLSVLFTTHGVKASRDGAALSLPVTTPEETSRILESLLSQPLPDPVRLAAFVANKTQDKYDEYLGEDLLNASYAARDLDLPGAWSTLEALTR